MTGQPEEPGQNRAKYQGRAGPISMLGYYIGPVLLFLLCSTLVCFGLLCSDLPCAVMV
jgi:hypothetical protein